jgi:hypothetical protein
MRVFKKLVVLGVLTFFLVLTQRPAEANACTDACFLNSAICTATAHNANTGCRNNAATEVAACINAVDAGYEACMYDCDTLYPWWSGCFTECFANRENGHTACEAPFEACDATMTSTLAACDATLVSCVNGCPP